MLSLDISRESFQRSKNYTGLRQQQGRIPLESELNEGSDIAAEELRRAIQDVICSSGTPDDGFRVSFVDETPAAYDFQLDPGTYYIGGRRYDCFAGTTFLSQPDWMQMASDVDPLPVIPTAERYDFAYIEAWEQVVSATEDSELFERALGGADGAGRLRRMARVRVATGTADNCLDAMADLFPDSMIDPDTMALDSGAGLTVGFDPDYVEENLCAPEVQAGYLGAENETFRVQLTAPDRFVFGNDNASHLYRVTLEADGDETIVTFITQPRDAHAHPLAGQAVEILRWNTVLPNTEKLAEPVGTLAAILTDYDPSGPTLRIDMTLADLTTNWDGAGVDDQFHYLRVWTGGMDQLIPDSTEIVMAGTGLTAAFQAASVGFGMTGDFWVIAARPNAPDVVTPWQLLDDMPPPAPPAGPMRHVAPLAVIHWDPTFVAGIAARVHDCRERFRKLCTVPTCCEVTVGDGERSHGDVDTIGAAIARIPEEGGKVCLLRGTFTESIVMSDRHDIEFSGCGSETTWIAAEDGPAVTMNNCQNISFSNVILEADNSDVVQAGSRVGPTDADQVCSGLRFDKMVLRGRDMSALWLNDCNDTKITDCQVEMRSLSVPRSVDGIEGADPAIFILGDVLHLEHNWIGVTQNPMPPVESRPLGGVQIGGLSEDVILRDNQIFGGKGNGVTLGHLEWVTEGSSGEAGIWTLGVGWYINEAGCIVPFLYPIPPEGSEDVELVPESGGEIRNLRIEDNVIRDMGLNGIAVCHFFDLTQGSDMIALADVRIMRNDILDCLSSDLETPPLEIAYFRSYGGIALASCDLLQIKGNRIQDNGANASAPVCGVFVLFGTGIEIDDNHIFANGGFGDDNLGRYGGVNIGWCLTHASTEPDRDARATPARRAALSMTGNVIDSPNGQAVKAVALGPVMMTGNQLVGTARSVLPIFQAIGLVLALLPRFTSLGLMLTSLAISKGISRDDFANAGMGLAELMIAAMGGSAVSVFNAAWLEEFSGLLDADAVERSGVSAVGGETMFDSNQVSLLPSPNGATNPVSSLLLASMDDVSLNSNQIEVDRGVGFMLSNAFTPAATVRMNSNRMQESPLSCLFSGISHSVFLNTQALNQGTHCFAATALLGTGSSFIQRHANMSLVQSLLSLVTDNQAYCEQLIKKLPGAASEKGRPTLGGLDDSGVAEIEVGSQAMEQYPYRFGGYAYVETSAFAVLG